MVVIVSAVTEYVSMFIYTGISMSKVGLLHLEVRSYHFTSEAGSVKYYSDFVTDFRDIENLLMEIIQ